MSEQIEEIPKIYDFPVEWQIVVRGVQSIISKAKDGADIEVYRTDNCFIFNTKKSFLEVTYYPERKSIKIIWKKYKTSDDKREVIFIKTIEKRIEEKEALNLISAWYEKILIHIETRSDTTTIYKDFFYLYNMFEELKKEKEETEETQQ
jgi:uncharacterized ubiquitin-like protein YukD